MIYDTLKLSQALRTSFTPDQAETLASAFAESTQDTVATKAGVRELRPELKTDVASMKTDLVRWIVTASAFNLLATVGLMVVVARLVTK